MNIDYDNVVTNDMARYDATIRLCNILHFRLQNKMNSQKGYISKSYMTHPPASNA